MWVYGMGHFSTLRQLDRFRVAQQNLRNASKDSENPESSDFDVFKRSISSKMADMKKLVETYNEELDKEHEVLQHGKGQHICNCSFAAFDSRVLPPLTYLCVHCHRLLFGVCDLFSEFL